MAKSSRKSSRKSNNKKSLRARKAKNATRIPRSVRKFFPNVMQAIDSDKSVDVVVEKRDNQMGEKGHPGECAMARAVKREYKADGVVIGLAYSYIVKKNVAIRFKTPGSVAREIVSFDRSRMFEPGEYSLNAVGKSQRLGRAVKYDKNRDHSGGDESSRKQKIIHKHHKTLGIRVLERGSSY